MISSPACTRARRKKKVSRSSVYRDFYKHYILRSSGIIAAVSSYNRFCVLVIIRYITNVSTLGRRDGLFGTAVSCLVPSEHTS